MQLYLSSYRIGNMGTILAEMVGSRSIALIPNALDATVEDARQAVIDRTVCDLQAIGLDAFIVDLRDYFHPGAMLSERLAGFRAMFVTGGNVFVLRRAMAQSGLDDILLSNRQDAGFLYAGYSAGSCVCSPRLDALALVDDPYVAPIGYDPKPIWEGLALIPFVFVPHFRSDHPESDQVETLVSYCKDHNVLYRAYRDGEVLVGTAGCLA